MPNTLTINSSFHGTYAGSGTDVLTFAQPVDAVDVRYPAGDAMAVAVSFDLTDGHRTVSGVTDPATLGDGVFLVYPSGSRVRRFSFVAQQLRIAAVRVVGVTQDGSRRGAGYSVEMTAAA